MIKSLFKVAALAAITLLPASAMAQFNGWKTNARVFNDFTTSTLTISNSNTNPGTVVIDDRGFVDDGIGGNFANRHDVMASTNGGATAANINIGQGFTIQANVRLEDGSNAPRKEAGFRINSPVTGDLLFLVNSDAGEIVTFGGGGPFFSFGSNGGGNGYTPGQTILMGMTYRSGFGGNPGTSEYFINRGAGLETSGQLAWSNTEGGPVNFNVGVYGQFSPNLSNTQDFATATFNNLSIVAIPEPASIGLLSLAGVSMLARRRKSA
ncbi:hypothetical protein BH09PLA1_BH09PLA1_35090 [soil metagenome]